MKKKILIACLGMTATLFLASCATPTATDQKVQAGLFPHEPISETSESPWNTSKATQGIEQRPAVQATKQPYIKLGSGNFLGGSARASAPADAKGNITLNFEGVDIREIIKVIFEEILSENYLIDPKVQGVATLHTTNPVASEAVLPILESVLELNGAAIVHDDGIYKVIPLANVRKEVTVPSVGKKLPRNPIGFGVQIVPLQYVSAKDIKKILDSVSPDAKAARIDESRNLVILSGPLKRISNLVETIKIFDVDWLKGMSFGILPLQYADATTLTGEMSKIIGPNGEGPLSGIVKLIPIERMNSVLVITHQPRYLEQAKGLIEQFDQGTDSSPGRRLFVYRLKHGKAENIATVLQEIYGQSTAGDSNSNPAGRPPEARANVRPPVVSAITTPQNEASGQAAAQAAVVVAAAQAPVSDAGSDILSANQGQVTIIADQDNNSILVLASARDYRSVEATLRRLDIAPKQVLIEATVAEVKLTDNLSYGIRWFLEGKAGDFSVDSGLGTPLPSSVSGDGFTLGLLNGIGEVRALFDLLDSESTVKFLSAPQLMVIDNQTATIRVGDQIPIVTRSSTSTTDPDAPIVTEVQFRDTGTLMTVTPRIKDGGMVTLEVSQEVSIPGTTPAVGGGGNVPISQRTVESTVLVHSGQTVILGGLIRENNTMSKAGVPVLQFLPVVGNLFGSTTKDIERTELLVTLRPRVIDNPQDALDVTKEIRKRMRRATAVEAALGQPQELPARRW